jgi:formylglycine-generating enzyme required for sulfatase activity
MRNYLVQICVSIAAFVLPLPAVANPCDGDVVVDGRVDGSDLGGLLANWGPVTATPYSQACDLDGNAIVDGADLGVLLNAWGPCPTVVPAWAILIEGPPNAEVMTDPALRAAIATTGLAWRVRDRSTQIEMLLVPPGVYQMGCTSAPYPGACQPSELPLHQVTLTNAFYLGRFEVTQAQWTATGAHNASYFRDYPDSADRPVERVAWTPIQSFLLATGMRLPTEAEWEFACRAGTLGPLYNNSMDEGSLAALAWYASNSLDKTHPVGQRAPNPLGFYDMLGNVWEIVDDWFDSYSSVNQTNPLGPKSGYNHVARGGSWETASYEIRASFRFGTTESLDFRQGFRVARNP